MGELHIVVIAGGWSGEREVSLRSGEAVFNALDKRKYRVSRYDPSDGLVTLIENRKEIDLAFVLLHGKFGEDGCIQGFLQLLGIPFVGSGVLASAMALHKKIAKEVYRGAGLNVIKDVMVLRGESFSVKDIMATLGPETVVKPVAEGSSLGMSLCRSERELLQGIETAFRYDNEVMVEAYVGGREVTCCVLGNSNLETLPLIEIVPDAQYPFFDYRAKYIPGATREICPAPLSSSLSEKAEFCAKEAHRALKCRVWSRTDMIIQDEDVYILETNTIPGMTETSLVPLAAKTAGMSMSQLVDKVIELSLEQEHK